MAFHKAQPCPRCGNAFECKPGNISECQCFGISFSEEEKTFVGYSFSGCLCRFCLLALKQEFKYHTTKQKPERMQSLIHEK